MHLTTSDPLCVTSSLNQHQFSHGLLLPSLLHCTLKIKFKSIWSLHWLKSPEDTPTAITTDSKHFTMSFRYDQTSISTSDLSSLLSLYSCHTWTLSLPWVSQVYCYLRAFSFNLIVSLELFPIVQLAERSPPERGFPWPSGSSPSMFSLL